MRVGKSNDVPSCYLQSWRDTVSRDLRDSEFFFEEATVIAQDPQGVAIVCVGAMWARPTAAAAM